MILPRVYPILDTGALQARNVEPALAAEAFVEGGAQILQIRHKGVWDRTFFHVCEEIARICAHIPLIVNDRSDFAMYVDAGVHLGQDDLSPTLVRPFIKDAVIGFSTHNAEQMRAAVAQPINYVAFGPVFGTTSKERPDPTTGIENLRAVRALTDLPLVAIGGITRENASICWQAGADSVAVIGDLLPAVCTGESIRDRMVEWRQISLKG